MRQKYDRPTIDSLDAGNLFGQSDRMKPPEDSRLDFLDDRVAETPRRRYAAEMLFLCGAALLGVGLLFVASALFGFWDFSSYDSFILEWAGLIFGIPMAAIGSLLCGAGYMGWVRRG